MGMQETGITDTEEEKVLDFDTFVVEVIIKDDEKKKYFQWYLDKWNDLVKKD